MFRRATIACAGAALLMILATGCKKDEPQPEPTPAPTPTPPTVAEPDEPPPPAEEAGVVRAGLGTLRETPDKKGKWKTTLMRGEKVAVVEKAGEGFLKVKLSDGTEGYITEKSVLVGEVDEVLVIEDRPLYDRPDSASPRKGTVKVGTLLFVVNEKDGWVEVQLPKGNTGWMKDDHVDRDADELAAARAVFRYELLKDSKQEARRQQAKDFITEALENYPDSKVLAAAGFVAGEDPDKKPEEEEKPVEDDADKPVGDDGTKAAADEEAKAPAPDKAAGAAAEGKKEEKPAEKVPAEKKEEAKPAE